MSSFDADRTPLRPRLWPAFFKGHGLGNDYLVIESGDAWTATAEAVARVCRRHRGVGSDGIVCLTGRPSGDDPEDPWRLRMFNPDGSEFERSGNGLRVFAAYLASRGEVTPGTPFPVEVGGDRLRVTVHGPAGPGGYDVAVAMGRLRLGPGAVGLQADEGGVEDAFTHPDLGRLEVVPVSAGNPHCVVFGLPLTSVALTTVGPFLERHDALASGTNVQLVEGAGDARIRILIWERGVGETSASGTSACATAVAAVQRGVVERGEITVQMPGGEFLVRVDEDHEVVLRGPVEEVSAGRLAPGFLDALEGSSTSGPGAGG